jgi:transcription termination factor Rho
MSYFEEFKGTGNMELQLDRKLLTNVFSCDRFNFFSTRRDDLLLDEKPCKECGL